MYKNYNNNPSGAKIGDCVVRAISTAIGQPWDTTYIELCLQGYLMSDLPSSNAVWNAYLKNKGYTRRSIHEDCPDCYNIADFAEEFPCGTYIVGTGTHATTVINGAIVDTWDCSGEHPLYYYVKEE